MDARALFPTYMFSSSIPQIDNVEIKKYALDLKSKIKSEIVSNRNGWQSPSFNSTEHYQIKKVVDEISKRLELIYKNLDISRKPKLANYWININGPTSYNERHNHTLSFFSCVYYVAVPKNSGDFIIERDDESKFFLQYFEKENEHSAQAFMIEPTESQILIFPSWVYHSVGQNNSQDDRISIAFNFI